VLRWLPLVFTVVVVQVAPTIAAQQAATEAGTLQRRYTDGAVSHYLMTGNNDGWQYTIQATDVVSAIRMSLTNVVTDGAHRPVQLLPGQRLASGQKSNSSFPRTWKRLKKTCLVVQSRGSVPTYQSLQSSICRSPPESFPIHREGRRDPAAPR
jgi:hypothetical protein